MGWSESVAEPPAMRWWGWGEAGHPPTLGLGALAFLREHGGGGGAPRAPVALGSVRLEPSRLSAGAAHALREVVGAEGLRSYHGERVLHAAGKGYPDLVRLRAGVPEGAPDAVLHPGDRAQL